MGITIHPSANHYYHPPSAAPNPTTTSATTATPTTSAAARDRLYRAATLGGVSLTLLLLIHLTATTKLSQSALLPPSYYRTLDNPTNCPPPSSTTTQAHPPRIANRTRMLQITADNRNMVYLHAADILVMTMAKAGTSTTWHWLYPGVTGRPSWNNTRCATYVHDMRSHCWRTHASFLHALPPDRQHAVLTSPDTLRVAIQRNPYERTLSSFKSKFTCEHERFATDVHNRRTMVPALRNRCGMPPGPPCMNISDFAQTLDSCRRNVGRKGYLSHLRLLDVHIRPQQFFFDEIDYDMVIDVRDLSDLNVLHPIIERVQYRHLVKDGVRLRHASGDDQLEIPEKAAAMLYAYAMESQPGKLKYIPGHEPTTTTTGNAPDSTTTSTTTTTTTTTSSSSSSSSSSS